MYTVRGRTAATAGVANDAVFQVWNPHSTQRIRLLQVRNTKTVGLSANILAWRRSTARGTPGSTVTPDIDHHSERALAPVSGFLLDLAAFTVQPTLDASDLGPIIVSEAVISWTYAYPFPGNGIVIPPGTGYVAIQLGTSGWPISDVTVVVMEE